MFEESAHTQPMLRVLGWVMGMVGEGEGGGVVRRECALSKGIEELLKSFFFLSGLPFHTLDDILIFLHELLVLNEEMSTHLF